MYTHDTIKGHSVAELSSKSRFQWDATETMEFYRCLVRDQLTKKLIKTADLEQLRRDLGLSGYPPAVDAIVDPKLRYKLTSCFNNTRPYLGDGYPNWCKRWLDDTWDGDISKPTDMAPNSAYQSVSFETNTPPRLVLEHWVARSPPRPPSLQSMDIDEPSSQWEHMPTESVPKAAVRDKPRHGVDEKATRIEERREAWQEAARVEELRIAKEEAAEHRKAREEAAMFEARREGRKEAARVEELRKASAEAAERRRTREDAAKIEARRKDSEDRREAKEEAARVEERRKASEDRRKAKEEATRLEELRKVKEEAAKVEERCKASEERRKASEERRKAKEAVTVEELHIVREKAAVGEAARIPAAADQEHQLWALLQQQCKPQFTRPRYSPVPSEVTVTSSMIAAAQTEVDKTAPTMSPGSSSVSSPQSWTFKSDEIDSALDKLAAAKREYQNICLVKEKNLKAYESNVIATANSASELARCQVELKNLLKS